MALRQQLEPIEHADMLRDTLENHYPSARYASVLIGLFDQKNEIHVAFIRRASTLRAHGGEIAFPGGAHHGTSIYCGKQFFDNSGCSVYARGSREIAIANERGCRNHSLAATGSC